MRSLEGKAAALRMEITAGLKFFQWLVFFKAKGIW